MNIKYPLSLLTLTATLFAVSGSVWANDADDRIESAAKKSYVYKTYLKEDSIKTESKNGVVTLSGTVTQQNHKNLAENTVESLPGVTSVNNELTVKGETYPDESDAWINVQVNTALLFHSHVRATKTDVDVKNGIVTLRGVAESQAQKDLTTEYTKDIAGVKEVRNEMTISKNPSNPKETMGEKMDDASITAQVKWSLMAHRSTSVLNTKIKTQDGVVNLSGTAKNESEKSLATKLVSNINGVTRVNNSMTIE